MLGTCYVAVTNVPRSEGKHALLNLVGVGTIAEFGARPS